MKKRNKMDELEKNIPDDFWRKAFDEADETPPPRVWSSIERQLDESNSPKILPLWGSGLASSQPVIWGTGIAAALALLLVGWWVMNTQSANKSVARIQASSPASNVAIAPEHVRSTNSSPSLSKSSGQASEAIVASANKSSRTSASKSLGTSPEKALEASEQQIAKSASKSPATVSRKLGQESVAQVVSESALKDNLVRMQTTAATALRSTSSIVSTETISTPATSRMAAASFTPDRSVAAVDVTSNLVGTTAYELLRGRPLRFRSLGPIQRIVWFQPAEELPVQPEITKEQRKKREMWASASVMPGSFNPSVSMHSAQTSFVNTSVASNSNSNKSAVSSRANFSVAYQAGAGVQLTDRWSVESGIGYLAAHSTVESPAQSTALNYIQSAVADRTNAVSGNLYVDALRNSSSNNTPLAYSPTNNSYLSQGTYTSQTLQTLTNDYQYMQVPIQVGYQLRPKKRLSLAVLGGLLTNIFVRNTVGNDVVVTAKDGVYRPVSLAATMGARLRYRPSGQWSASLAGLYQPSLGLGTQADSQVQTHPTSTGMSFGVDYHF